MSVNAALRTSIKRTQVGNLRKIKQPTQIRSLEQGMTIAKISLRCILKSKESLFIFMRNRC